MISNTFKKQLIINAYNTQLLPENDEIYKTSFNTIKRMKNRLLFKIEEFLWLDYKYKNDNIDYDISWFSYYLTYSIYSIYKYNENEDFNIQEETLFSIKKALQYKHNIKDSPDYAEYLEEVYD